MASETKSLGATMKHSGSNIERIFNENLTLAIAALAAVPIARGRTPSFQGLNGWVYEQTIRSCLEDELQLQNVALPLKEQQTLKGRAKVDLIVEGKKRKVAIEIKAGGIFGNDAERYKKYCEIAQNEKKWTYLYVTKQETHKPYYDATKAVFGPDAAFFLNEENGWHDFVTAVIKASTPDQNHFPDDQE